MYAKCGRIGVARQVFDKMSSRDVGSWNAMILGYGIHGQGEDAVALFSQMQQTGTKPDHITFTAVLTACSHAGLVDQGWQYFECMKSDYGLVPKLEHYACLVDLLGRAGHLDEAHDIIKKMPLEPQSNVWGALLGACRIHGNIELGEQAAKHLFKLEPNNAGYYVLLSNIYAEAGRWEEVAKLRTMMKEREVKKQPGCSFIEVNREVQSFLVRDKTHPQSEKIYATLENVYGQMKKAGYVPNTNLVLHDVEEEMKEDILCSHSEKLAISFGIINTSPGTPIRIMKNLRVCRDCHNATKFICKIVGREIIVRDANRFHHFTNGLCSCGDHW
jgi:pentatricopeptide repeat protein